MPGNLVGRVPGVAVVQGAQGSYQANHSGQTTLATTIDPLCRAATPPCSLPSIGFQIQIVVK